MLAEGEAVACYPPTPNGGADRCKSVRVPFSANTSTTVQSFGDVSGSWVTITADQDCYIHTLVTNDIGAASVESWPVWSKSYLNFWIGNYQYFRVCGGTSSGSLWFYLSSR